MGLMDKVATGRTLHKPATSLREQYAEEEVVAHGKALMDSIETHGAPESVVLVHEHDYVQGGRDLSIIVWLLIGGMFFFVPIGMVMMIGGAMIGGGEIVGIGWICLPVLLIILVPLGKIGWGIFSGSAQALFSPEPVENVTRKLWYDPGRRFLTAFLHVTDEETGQEYYPELDHAVFVESTDVISILVDKPSDGAVSFGSRTVILQDPTDDGMWVSSMMHFQPFEYGETTDSEELGRLIAQRMDLKFKTR